MTACIAASFFATPPRRPPRSRGAASRRRGIWRRHRSRPRRIFEITTRIEILQPSGPTRVWVPTPLAAAPYQETLGDTYHLGDDGRSVMVENEDVDMLVAEWPAGAAPMLTLTSRVATMGHAANLTEPTVAPPLSLDVFSRFLRPTRLIPTDGIVKETAATITRGAGTDLEKARAIYEWIVDNTFRDPKTRRLWNRRHPLHAGVEEPERKMRRPQFTVRRPGARRQAFRRAMSGASASRSPRAVCEVWACRPTTRRRRSTAAPKSIWSATAGCPSTPPTSEKRRSKSRRATCR